MEKVIIKQNQKKQLHLCFLSLILILVCVFDIIINENNIVVNILIKCICIIGIFFFGLCFIIIFKDFIKPRPLLIADEEGILIKSNKNFIIPWNEIEFIGSTGLLNQKFLGINLKAESESLKKIAKNKKSIFRLNKKLTDFDIDISLNNSSYTVEEVILMLDNYKKTYCKKEI